MFVSIDMDNLVFLHKHHDHETLSALSWLECGQQVSIRVEPSSDNSRFLTNMSDLDVRMLYKNTTGQSLPKESDTAALRYQLGDITQLMPVSRVLTNEVLAQVEAVDARLYAGERFKYAFGSKMPAEPQELFPLKARPLNEKELLEAQMRSRNPVHGYKPRLTGEPRKPWEPEETVLDAVQPQDIAAEPVAEQPKAGKARAGSVKPVIFAAVKAAWDAKPAGEAWDVVRKRIIPELEAQGLHPTTIRIKLSEWAKENGI